MTEPLRNHGDATTVTAVQAPQWHRTSGVTGVLGEQLALHGRGIISWRGALSAGAVVTVL